MKILVVGEDGQLGNDCQKLLRSSHNLLTPSHAELDLRFEDSVLAYIDRNHPDIIINCAAFTAVDDCESKRDLAWQINGSGPDHLARAAEKISARLIHNSTDYVFDGNKPIPEAYSETDEVNPLSEYGKSKLAGESSVAKQCSNHLILRTAWLYSAHGPNFLKTMLRLALADPERQLKVVNDQFGSLTWSHTLAKQIQLLLDSELTGITHATSEGYSSWYEGACYFLDAMKVPYNIAPCTTEEYPTPAHRPANSILANSQLKDAEVNVFRDWREDIDQYVAEFGDKLRAETEESLK